MNPKCIIQWYLMNSALTQHLIVNAKHFPSSSLRMHEEYGTCGNTSRCDMWDLTPSALYKCMWCGHGTLAKQKTFYAAQQKVYTQDKMMVLTARLCAFEQLSHGCFYCPLKKLLGDIWVYYLSGCAGLCHQRTRKKGFREILQQGQVRIFKGTKWEDLGPNTSSFSHSRFFLGFLEIHTSICICSQEA